MTIRLCVVGAGALCAAAVSAFGQVTYVARSSLVRTTATQGVTHEQSTTSFDPFAYNLSTSGVRSSASAIQETSLSSSGVNWLVHSYAGSQFPSNPNQGPPGVGEATNTFSVTFDVASPIEYALAGELLFWDSFDASCFVRLTRDSGVDGAAVIFNLQDGHTEISAAGTLTPGRYTFSIDCNMTATFGSALPPRDGSGHLTFTPTPGAAAVMGMAGVFAARRRR